MRTENSVFSEDDNLLVIGVSGEAASIGYFGFSYFINNRERLKAVSIDGGSGPIFPTREAVNNGSYAPLSRPLFIYASTSALEYPHVEAFVRFNLTVGRSLIDSPEVGYVQLPDAVYELLLDRLNRRINGSPLASAGPGLSLYEMYSEG